MGDTMEGELIQDPNHRIRKLARKVYDLARKTREEIIKFDFLDNRGLGWGSIIRYEIRWGSGERSHLMDACYSGLEKKDGKYTFGISRELIFDDVDVRGIWDQVETRLIEDVRRDDVGSLKGIYRHPKESKKPRPYVPRVFKLR